MGIIFDDKRFIQMTGIVMIWKWEMARSNALYKFGSKDSPLKYILRGILWKKLNIGTTEKTEITWLDEFRPECVFTCIFSNDYFIPLNCLIHIGKCIIYQLCTCIGDDYYLMIESHYHHFIISIEKS